MSTDMIASYATAAFLLIGAGFALVAAIGLLRFNDAMTRMHAPTKIGTIGVGALLAASMTHAYATGDGSFHELLIMAFLFVTAPISANFIAKVHIHRRTCVTPPVPNEDDMWSTLDAPPDERVEEAGHKP